MDLRDIFIDQDFGEVVSEGDLGSANGRENEGSDHGSVYLENQKTDGYQCTRDLFIRPVLLLSAPLSEVCLLLTAL